MDNKKMRSNKIKKASILSLFLCAAMLCGCGSIPGKGTGSANTAEAEEKTEHRDYIEKTGVKNLSEEELAKKGRYEDARSRLADMTVCAEDDKLILYLDSNHAEFAVVEKATGQSWFSTPYDFENDLKSGSDTKKILQALVNLTYYDKSAREGSMNSYTDCTAKDQYQVERLKNGFAFHMQIGRVEEGILLPYVVEITKFEEKILPSVSEKEARRLKSYYTKVSLADVKLSESVKEGYLKNYPGLSDTDFYILRDVVDREKRMIEEIIRKTEYTEEDLNEDLAASGYVNEDSTAALFELSLYVELENGSLKVTVPADTISYDTSEFYLASFSLLNYFGAGKSEEDGYLFVPDGSGALIYYNKYGRKKILSTINTVYGMDYSLSLSYQANSLSAQIYLPVFGNKAGEKAMMAILEDGETLAKIISESGNMISSYETVYPEFHYETSYTVNYTDSTKIKGLYTYHDTNVYQGDYVVRYQFLTGEEADYTGMAKSYREYLEDHGVLTKLPETESGTKLYLEALGALEKTSARLGIPYLESVALTSFTQAQDILAELSEAGVEGMKLRYKGWMNGGLYYTASNRAKVLTSLGGKKELAGLESYALSKGIGLYPEADFFQVRNTKAFDGYSSSRHSANSIQREKLFLLAPQEFTNLAYFQYASYSVSPYYYSAFMKKFFKEYDALNLSGISVGNMGTMLYSEYSKKKAVNREEVRDLLEESLKTYEKGRSLMVDGGNAYTLPYADDLVNVPLYNSAYTLEDESIPFLQLVLHGYKHYAGSAMNLSGDYRKQFLRNIEYGSNPFFTIAAEHSDLLKETAFCYYYSVDWKTWKGQITECAMEWQEAYNGLENQAMIAHEKVADRVYRTEYEDGTVFYVNYNDSDVTLPDGSLLAARDYRKVSIH
ncbi:hypothetical protein HNQ56_001489 [Anaerotaenia torta]|uniref:DUF5696 domain-containing protein n=1 Tax=Anaerotaenia torta TaxID=433293 RepID=UPI003D24B1EB